MANGALATSSSTTQATERPPKRRPANQATGRVATEMTPESDRTPRFEVPNTFIQKCRRT